MPHNIKWPGTPCVDPDRTSGRVKGRRISDNARGMFQGPPLLSVVGFGGLGLACASCSRNLF